MEHHLQTPSCGKYVALIYAMEDDQRLSSICVWKMLFTICKEAWNLVLYCSLIHTIMCWLVVWSCDMLCGHVIRVVCSCVVYSNHVVCVLMSCCPTGCSRLSQDTNTGRSWPHAGHGFWARDTQDCGAVWHAPEEPATDSHVLGNVSRADPAIGRCVLLCKKSMY